VSDGSSRLDQGWRKIEAGDYASALHLSEAELRTDPENPDALLLLGACHRWQGELPEAIAAFTRAAAADPAWSEPALWLAEIYAQEMDSPSEALGHAATALERAEEEEEFLDAVVLKAGIEIQLGRLRAAQETLSELPPAGEVDLPAEQALDLAHLFLEAEMGEEAERRFRLLVDKDAGDAEAWYGLGLCAEERGDEAGKRVAWRRVLELDRKAPLLSPHMSEAEMAEVAEQALQELPKAAPLLSPHMSEAEMAEVAEQALQELPKAASRLIVNVPILVVDLPAVDEVELGLDPRLLGLFEGAAYAEASSVGGSPQVTRILLFRTNLERLALDREDLREQIRITLLHETGHFFGMTEADLAGVGLD
jgi:predicted Zn-dependent protease with MMP-like domain/Flp pilus assembly protein TadD